jgi:hypothetical protein
MLAENRPRLRMPRAASGPRAVEYLRILGLSRSGRRVRIVVWERPNVGT